MYLTAELKNKLLACLREEFEDDDEMTPVIREVTALPVDYDLNSVDLDPTWDDLVEDTNWIDAWLRYFQLIHN